MSGGWLHNSGLCEIFPKPQRSGKTLRMYESCLPMRLDGKRLLVVSSRPGWDAAFIDKEDKKRFGRKIGNYTTENVFESKSGNWMSNMSYYFDYFRSLWGGE